MKTIVAISDTHNQHNKITIPACDILIHAGDFTLKGHKSEVKNFTKWINKQPAKEIVVVAGNHELIFERNLPESKEWFNKYCERGHLLINGLVEIDGIRIYGLAYTPWFCNWAFNRSRNEAEVYLYKKPLMKDEVDNIPDSNIDIFVSHGPVYNILDELAFADGTPNGQHVGCVDLAKKIKKIKPDLFINGHIHCAYGEEHIDGTSYYNVSCLDEMYCVTNPITIIGYE